MPSTEDPKSAESVVISEDTDTPGQATMATKNVTQHKPSTQGAAATNNVSKSVDEKPVDAKPEEPAPADPLPKEYGGPAGLEPTRYGDWEKNGRCSDF